MKTIKQLEQEIDDLEIFYDYEGGSKYNKLEQLKTTLKQTIAIKEMIEEFLKDGDYTEEGLVIFGNGNIKELLTKINGGEEK